MQSKLNNLNLNKLKKKANYYRRVIFDKFCLLKEGHPGSIFSIIEVLVYLFEKKLIRVKSKKLFDKIIISKGHATSALYPILVDKGIVKKKEWLNWGIKKSILRIFGNTSIPGIDATTGSLGHGAGVGAGYAKSFKMDKKDKKVFVLISEGELYEGSTWEALLFAAHHKLDNLFLVLDVNNLIILGKTSECLGLDPIINKFKSFGFNTYSCNGHNFKSINNVFVKIKKNGKPNCVIINTIKGKGISFMENKANWHYWNPLDENTISITKKKLKNG